LYLCFVFALCERKNETQQEGFAGSFSPCGAKKNLQKKESTMLPQAKGDFV
jgi:hypothetical protein